MSNVDNIKSKDDYMNANLFHWFTGVVEDVNDPEQRGRYRVRCFGYHTERKDYIPTTTLPWAHVLMPVTGASQSGVGQSATGLLRGSWVVGFFRDGPTAQDPLIMGTIPAVTPAPDYNYGFTDPTQQYPYPDKIGDQDIPEEAISKDEKYKTSYSYLKKTEHRIKYPTVPVAFGAPWFLPPVDTIVKPEYPKNHVRAYERKMPVTDVVDLPAPVTGILEGDKPTTFDGEKPLITTPPLPDELKRHVEEIDATPDWERMSWIHASGTYKEWTPLGDETVVIEGDEYRIVAKNQHINVKGDCTITVEGNCHTMVLGNEFKHVLGNKVELINGQYVQTVLGNTMKIIAMNELRLTGVARGKAIGLVQGEAIGGNDYSFTSLNKMNMVGVNDTDLSLGTRNVTTALLNTRISGPVSEFHVRKDTISIFDMDYKVLFGSYKIFATFDIIGIAGNIIDLKAGVVNITGAPVNIVLLKAPGGTL
jgi:hypothetical protein